MFQILLLGTITVFAELKLIHQTQCNKTAFKLLDAASGWWIRDCAAFSMIWLGTRFSSIIMIDSIIVFPQQVLPMFILCKTTDNVNMSWLIASLTPSTNYKYCSYMYLHDCSRAVPNNSKFPPPSPLLLQETHTKQQSIKTLY